MDNAEKLASLLDYVQAERRICPQPRQWNEMCEMLPDKQRDGTGWNPPLPLILAAWHFKIGLEKQHHFLEHIKYAYKKGVLDKVDTFL